MKKLICLLLINVVFLFSAVGQRQELKTFEISINKTTHIYFESNVVYVDVGSPDDIAWEKQGDFVKITSKVDGFEYESNLTVHTEKGVYMFNLVYNGNLASPIEFVDYRDMLRGFPEKRKVVKKQEIVFSSEQPASVEQVTPQSEPEEVYNEPEITESTPQTEISPNQIAKAQRAYEVVGTINDVGLYQDKMFALISGVYVAEDKIFVKMEFKNESSIGFEIAYTNFTLDKKKLTKKSAFEPEEKLPVYVYNTSKRVKSNGGALIKVFVFDKFIIEKDKKLVVEVGGNNGRHLKFNLKNKYILDAKKI